MLVKVKLFLQKKLFAADMDFPQGIYLLFPKDSDFAQT